MIEVRDGLISRRKVNGKGTKRKRDRQKEEEWDTSRRAVMDRNGWMEGQVNKRKDGRAWRRSETEGMGWNEGQLQ